MKLEGKVALVTGGARGLGAATSLKLADEGASVVVNDVDLELAQELADNLEERGVQAEAIRADVSQKDQVTDMVEQIADRFDRIDILVNNAGILDNSLLVDMSEEQWDRVIDINLKGSFLCAQAVAPLMMQQKAGAIVNISSEAAYGSSRGHANYSSSKAGIIGLTKTMAIELGPFGITVNAVAPGFIKSDMTYDLGEELGKDFDEWIEERSQGIPLRRVGEPMDVANAVYLLVSPEAGYINGEIVHLQGGP